MNEEKDKKKWSPLAKGMLFTWWAVASVVIGGIIRIEFLPPEYEFTFFVASSVYGIGWFMSVMINAMESDR